MPEENKKKVMNFSEAEKQVYLALMDKLCAGLSREIKQPKEELMKDKKYAFGLLSGIMNTLFTPHIPNQITDARLNRMLGFILDGVVRAHGDMGTGLEVQMIDVKPGEKCPSCGEIHMPGYVH